MSRPLQFASGVSVVFTTLAFAHIVFHNTVHMVSEHHARLLFVGLHTVLALAVAILSLTGAYVLLRGPQKQNPS